ncbi:MAG: hypothetical protein NXI30_04610 [bacterium]|nr:hypothetical protein [bacterium]
MRAKRKLREARDEGRKVAKEMRAVGHRLQVFGGLIAELANFADPDHEGFAGGTLGETDKDES